MKKRECNDGVCSQQCEYLCRCKDAYMYCRKFDKTKRSKHWVKLYELIDELEVLREYIQLFSDVSDAKLHLHRRRIGIIKYRIAEQFARIMQRAVHRDELKEYFSSSTVEDV